MTNPGPRLYDFCPAYRNWIDECDALLKSGNESAADYAWRQAVRAARQYRQSLSRPLTDALQ
jgi:hypothetical protein